MKKIFSTLLLLLTVVASEAIESGTIYSLSIGDRSVFVSNASLDANANAVLWTDTKVPAQRWLVSVNANNNYTFRNVYSDYYLGFASASSGASVTQRAYSDSYCQWSLTPVDGQQDTYYIYEARNKKYCLAVESTTADGVALKLADPSTTDASLCQFVIESSADTPTSFNTTSRDDMMDGFINQYYHDASSGHVLGGGGWWGDAEMFETILDAFATTGDTKYETYFSELYNNFLYRNGTDWSGNEFNDDITWMVLACIRAYKYFGNEDYLEKAKSNYDTMYKRAVQKYGTLIWKQSQTNKLGTNSCINCPATIAACYLAQLTGDDSYYDKALSIYAGQRKLLFVPSTGQVYDCGGWLADGSGVDSGVNKWASTYNQGTMLGAAVQLYLYTKDSQYLQDADKIYEYTIEHLTNSHKIISVCQTINGDLCGFKGILMRYVRMYAETFHKEDALKWIQSNAYHAYQNRMSRGVIWSAWLTKTAESLSRKEGNDTKDITNDAFGASTAVSAAFNAHVNCKFTKNAFANIGAEYFDDIQFAQLAESATDGSTPNTSGNDLTNGYICFRNVDFGTNMANQIILRLNTSSARSFVRVYADSIADSQLLGRSTGFLKKTWSDVTIDLSKSLSGTHDIYVQFSGTGVQLHYIRFASANFLYPDLTDNGGQLSVSPSVESAEELIDNAPTTDCTMDASQEVVMQYNSSCPLKLKGYALCSSTQSDVASPTAWRLEGSNDGSTWSTIDERSSQDMSGTGSKLTFDISPTETYTYLRLVITAATGTNLYLSDWQLYGTGLFDNDITDDGGVLTAGLSDTENAKLTDNDATTQGSFTATNTTILYKATTEYILADYSITCGDETDSAPSAWKLYGSQDGDSWTLIDEREAQSFLYANSTNVYKSLESTGPFSYFKLVLSAASDQTSITLADFQLIGNVNYGTFYNDATADHGTINSSDDSDAQALIDNDGETISTVSGDEMWWQYDSPISISYLGISLVCGTDMTKVPTKVTVMGSDDGSTWSQVANATLNFTRPGERITKLYTETAYKSYRLYVRSVADGGTTAELAEWELLGTGIANDSKYYYTVSTIEPSTASALCNVSTSDFTTLFSSPYTITYTLSEAASVRCYSLTSGGTTGQEDRDPYAWTLEGSNDGENFVTLDSRSDITFATRNCTQFYDCNPDDNTYKYYRLNITAVNGAADLRLAEWQLLNLASTTGVNTIVDDASHASLSQQANQVLAYTPLPGTLEVYAISGQKEKQMSLAAGVTAVRLPQGIHLCVLQNSKERIVRKIVISNN